MEKSEWDYESEFDLIKDKYNLPDYEKLADDFDIEKLAEKETAYLIREIRRTIVEKFSAYLHLFETLINPTSPPMFIFSVLRTVAQKDKDEIKKIYKRIARLQLKVMKLDTVYSEEKEAEFVRLAFDEWQTLKKTVFEILERLDQNFEENGESLKRGYFD